MSEVRAAAWRSYPVPEASGGQEETPHVQGQGQPGEATSLLRPGMVTLRSHTKPEAAAGRSHLCPRPGAATLRSHREPKARDGT